MSGELQTRKRKDKRKKRGDDGGRQDDVQDKSSLNDRTEDDIFTKDESDEKNHEDHHDSHHHENSGGVVAKILFAMLFLGLLASLGTIFFQLKGTDLADTPIKESRYVNILESFVDEHVDDHHDDHAEGHDESLDHDEHDEHDDEHDEHDEEASEADEEEHKSEEEETVTHIEEDRGPPEPAEESRIDDHEPEQPSEPEVSEADEADESEAEEHVEEETAEAESVPKDDEVSQLEVDISAKEEEEQTDLCTEKFDAADDDNDDDDDDDKSQDEEISENLGGYDGFFEKAFVPASEKSQIEETEDDENVEQNELSRADSVAAEESQANVPDTEQIYRGYYEEFEEEEGDDDEDDEDDEDGDTQNDRSESLANQKEENDRKSRAAYPASSITNDYDYLIRDDLDEAHRILETAPEKSQKAFTTILEKYPKSPRAMYGKAMSLDRLSEMLSSNSILEQSIYLYRDILDLPDVPITLYKLAGFRCVDRMRFRGFHSKAIRVLQRMQQKLPKMVDILNQMAVTYLIMGQNVNAKEILKEALQLQPTSGFAKAHYGFVLKTEDKLYGEAAKYLQEGVESGEPGTLDGRFYFHLGDALTRDGKTDKALKVYEDGVRLGLFMSVYQRSLYNVPSLTARPWWSPEQTTYQRHLTLLERNWELIKSEAIPLLDDDDQGFFPENEGLRKKGVWKQFEMFAKGERITQNCERTPKTCRLIDSIPDAATCRRGQVKLSLLLPGTRVWPHTGPTNCRLRAHLGLVIPKGPKIRVANETREWKEGEFIIFDDSFEHEVWHDGDSYRLVLIVDFWHPELTANQKQTLPAI